MTEAADLSIEDAVAVVRANASLLGLALDEDTVQRVALYLQRTSAIARLLEAWDLQPSDELAEIYHPDRRAAGIQPI